MNPIFIFLVVVATVILWFLLSFVFFPLGKLVYRIWKDAMDNIKGKKEGEKAKDEQ